MNNGKRILLTGPPGVGKTTLVKQVCEVLRRDYKIPVSGFYTEEMRANGERTGFKVVTMDGQESVLAMKSNLVGGDVEKRSPSVGQYSVNIASFEKTAMPTLQGKGGCLLVIDEIGKMELFSKPFSAQVRRIFNEYPSNVLATIPIARGKALQVVGEISSREDVQIITVSKENRESLVMDIVSQLTE